MKENETYMKTVILMYHGIADVDIDPWSIFVSPSNFDEHIKILTKYFNTTSLKDTIDNASDSKFEESVVVTFDDGYANNYFQAKPILERYNMPSTFLIASDYLDGNREYWWDELEQIVFTKKSLPDGLEINIGNRLYSWEVSAEDISYTVISNELFPDNWWLNPPSIRHNIYLDVWSALRIMNVTDQYKYTKQLSELCGLSITCRNEYRILQCEELRELSNTDYFEIGSHGRNHYPLTYLEKNVLYDEISQSKKILENTIDDKIYSFSYPYGDYNELTINALKDSNYKCALTTFEEVETSAINKFELPRLHVKNWTGEEFLKKIRSMFNLKR